MTDLIVCPSCKKLTRHDDVHTCYDHDALERLRSAEKAVVIAAEAMFHDTTTYAYVLEKTLEEAVATYRTERETP